MIYLCKIRFSENIINSEPAPIMKASRVAVVQAKPFLFDEEGILYADIDPEEIVKGRYEIDVAGHYNRPDIFSSRVNLPDENQ